MPGVLGTASVGPDNPGARRLACGLALLAGLCFHAVFIARAAFVVDGELTFSLFDDAMVSMTYARNFAEGHGLVWMPGEPPVEGYTNPLWTLVMVIPHLAGLPERLASLPIQALGALLLAATSVLAMWTARRLSDADWIAPATIAAVSFCYPLVFWTLRGLEVGLLACLVVAAALLALRLVERPSRRDRAWLTAVLAAAVSTRLDAVIFAAVVVAFLALAARRTRWDAAWAALATLAALGAQSVFRLAYYHALAPNTYYLKMSGHPLSDRLGRGIDTFTHLPACTLWVPLGLALGLLALRRTALGRAEALLVGLVGIGIAYSIYVGGDAWEWAHFANRYVSVVLPLLLVLALVAIEALRRAQGRAAAFGLGSAGLFIAGFSLYRLWSYGDGFAVAEVLATGLAFVAFWLGRWERIAHPPVARAALATLVAVVLVGLVNGRPLRFWIRTGGLHVVEDASRVKQALAIRAATSPDTRVAVTWAGIIPYFSHRPAVDLLGKNDPVIARELPRGEFGPGYDTWDYAYRGEFWPGHDKWDYAYSIGGLAPDLVVELWQDTPHDRQQMRAWGYEAVGASWVRAGARVDRSKLVPGD